MKQTTSTLLVLLFLLASYYTFVRFLRTTEFPSDYDTWTAKDKSEWMWNQVLADKGKSSSFSMSKLIYDALPQFLGGADFNVTETLFSDEFPKGRKKGIHSVGKVALIKMTFNDEAKRRGYTGSFEGSDYGVIRAAGGKAPSLDKSTASISIKVFRDGAPSGNIVGSTNLDSPKGSKADFFKFPFSNIVPAIHFSFSKDGLHNTGLNTVFKKASPNLPGITGLPDFG